MITILNCKSSAGPIFFLKNALLTALIGEGSAYKPGPVKHQVVMRAGAAADRQGLTGSVMKPILRSPACCAAAMAWATRS